MGVCSMTGGGRSFPGSLVNAFLTGEDDDDLDVDVSGDLPAEGVEISESK